MSPITNALSHFVLEDDKGEKKEIIDKENKEREGAFGPPQSKTKQYITSGHCLSTLQCQEVTQGRRANERLSPSPIYQE